MNQNLWEWGPSVCFCLLFCLFDWLIDCFLMISRWFWYMVRLKNSCHKIKPSDYLPYHFGSYLIYFAKWGTIAIFTLQLHLPLSEVFCLLNLHPEKKGQILSIECWKSFKGPSVGILAGKRRHAQLGSFKKSLIKRLYTDGTFLILITVMSTWFIYICDKSL